MNTNTQRGVKKQVKDEDLGLGEIKERKGNWGDGRQKRGRETDSKESVREFVGKPKKGWGGGTTICRIPKKGSYKIVFSKEQKLRTGNS